jgi:hypothetical protein
MHLAEKHPIIAQSHAYYSEIHFQLASLLGIAIHIDKFKEWKCPFGYCVAEFDRYSLISDQISSAHQPHENFLYEHVRGFWAPK